jgi:hypothetical protein
MPRDKQMILSLLLILFLALALPSVLRPQSTSKVPGAQSQTSDQETSVAIPWVATPPSLDCRSADWKTTNVVLSRQTGEMVGLGPSDVQDLPGDLKPAKVVAAVPTELQANLDSQRTFHFAWDEKNLYAWVEVDDSVTDNHFPGFSTRKYLRASAAGFLPDLLYDSVVLVVSDATPDKAGGRAFGGYRTEMRLFVRPPGAVKPAWTFFGRTVDEENFHELGGRAVACPSVGKGYVIKFAVSWLPGGGWQPEAGARLELNLITPLTYPGNVSFRQRAEGEKAYALQRAIGLVLTK